MRAKKNPSIQTLYAKNVDVWDRARRRAAQQDESFSQYVEKLLKADEANGLRDGEYQQLPFSA